MMGKVISIGKQDFAGTMVSIADYESRDTQYVSDNVSWVV